LAPCQNQSGAELVPGHSAFSFLVNANLFGLKKEEKKTAIYALMQLKRKSHMALASLWSEHHSTPRQKKIS
jgi:hypothetical protein